MSISNHIFLVGFMGAGKSTVAFALHRRLALPLVEMDERLVQEQGMSINEIFERFGEDRFRELESRLIVELGEGEPSVISCGGGVVVRPENIEHMKRCGRVVYLSATPETVYERVKNSTDRPVLNGHMSVEYIAGLMERRSALYEAAADVTIKTDGRGPEAICDEIVQQIEKL